MPSARSRRWASTVKPPTDTRAMSSMPTVASVSVMVAGLMALAAVVCGVTTLGPIVRGGTEGASNSTVTEVGARTWPGTSRANSSSRLCGFCTMPVTVRVTPPWCQTWPTARSNWRATPGVTATWPGPAG